MKKLILLLFCFGSVAWGQIQRFDLNVWTLDTNLPKPGNMYPMLAFPNYPVQICATWTSTGCTTLATTYTSPTGGATCPTSAQLVSNQVNIPACSSMSDPDGGVGGFANVGTYAYVLTTSYGTFGPYQFQVGGGLNNTGGPSHILSGCGVQYISALTFTVGTCIYSINGVVYNSPLTTITLPGGNSQDRIDVIGVDNTNSVISIQGTPNVQPQQPTVNPATQLELTFVYIPALAGAPLGITTQLIFDEGIGGEWNPGYNGNFVFSTNLPYHLTHDIEATAPTVNNFVAFSGPSNVNPLNWNSVFFYIRSKGTWLNCSGCAQQGIAVELHSGGAFGPLVGNAVFLGDGAYGFSSSYTTGYQQVAIPISAFGASSTPFNTVLFRKVPDQTPTIPGFYLDYVQLQGGLNTPNLPTTLMNFKGAWTATAAYNPYDTVTVGGLGYVALVANTNVPVSNPTTWASLASAGTGGFNGTIKYTTSHTLALSDNNYILQFNCSGPPCILTLPNPQPAQPMLVSVQSIGSTVATLALGSSMTYNGGAVLPTLTTGLILPIAANSQTATDYVGQVPSAGGGGSGSTLDTVTLAVALADAPTHAGRTYWVKDSIDCLQVAPWAPLYPTKCQAIGNSGFPPLLKQLVDPLPDSKQSRGGGFCVFADSTAYGDTQMPLNDSTFGIIRKAFNGQTNGCPGGQPPYGASGPFGGGGNYYNGGVGTLTGGNSTMGDYIDGQMLQNYAPLGDGQDPFVFVISDFGDDASCNGRSVGWGTIGPNCSGVAAGNVITAVTWAGTSPYGKISAQNTNLCVRGGGGSWSVPSNGFTHDIRTVTIASGGTNYVVGDLVAVQQGVAINGVVQVTAVSSGVVTGVTILPGHGGNGYVTGTNLATVNMYPDDSTGSGLTVNITAIDGYSLAGTVGATLTCTFPWTAPNASGFYLVWNVDGGANTATISIDGGPNTTISSGATNAYGTNYFSHMYWGQRFVSGNVVAPTKHSFVITVTAGTFQVEWFATAATNNYWDTYNYPPVVVDGEVYKYNLMGLDAVIGSTTQQLEQDGFHAFWANKNSCFPQTGADLEWAPGGSYSNGLTGKNENSPPHPNGMGMADVARCNLRAAGKVADPVPNQKLKDDSGFTTNIVNTGLYQQVLANGSNVDQLNRSNTHSVGNQTVIAGNSTTPGYIFQGSVGSAILPTWVRTFTGTTQSPTVCDNHTAPVTLGAGDSLLVDVVMNGGPFTGGQGYTLTTTAGDSFTITAASANLVMNVADGTSIAILTNLIGGSTQTVTVTTSGFNCNGYSIQEIHNVNTAHPINGSAFYYLNGIVPSQISIGTVNVSNPNDLLVTWYWGICSGSEGTPVNGNGLTWTSSFGGIACAYSMNNPATGTYSAVWNPNGVGGFSDRRGFFVALNGVLSGGQTGDAYITEDPYGAKVGATNPNGYTYRVGCTAQQVQAADGSGCITATLLASLTTTAAASDNVSITGVTATSHCSLTPTNASAATNVATTYVSAKTTNQITVTHTATASMTYDILCTIN